MDGRQGWRLFPIAPKGQKQTGDRLQPGQADLNERVFGLEQRDLCIQKGRQIDRTLAQPLFREREGASRRGNGDALGFFTRRILADGNQGIFYVGQCRDDGLAITLEELLPLGLRKRELTSEPAALENRLRDAGGHRVDGGLRPKQCREQCALEAGLPGELYGWQERLAGHIHISIGRGHLQFGTANIGPAKQQIGRDASCDRRQSQAADATRSEMDNLNGTSDQYGKRGARVFGGLPQRRKCRALDLQKALLLRDVELASGTGSAALANDTKYALCASQVLLRYGDALAVGGID